MESIEEIKADTERIKAETARIKEEHEKYMAEHDKRMAEWDAKRAEDMAAWEKRAKKLDEQIGGISNSNGEFAEEYFFNALDERKMFAGIHFDCVSNDFKNMVRMPNGKKVEDQFDIVMLNGKSVALIEIKYKAREKYVEELAEKKAKNFKILFPMYEKCKIYLGLGAFSFDWRALKKAEELGIGLLRQKGEAIEGKGDWKVKAY